MKRIYFQLTFDSDVIVDFFQFLLAKVIYIGYRLLLTKRRKRIFEIYLLRKDLKDRRDHMRRFLNLGTKSEVINE